MLKPSNTMYSPMRVVELNLDLIRSNEIFYLNSEVSQNYYDSIKTKDPNTVYHIKGTNKKYYGDLLVDDWMNKLKPNKYFLTINNRGEYLVFTFIENDISVVCMFLEEKAAVEALRMFNNIGSHLKTQSTIYKILCSFIYDEKSVHEAIMSILAACGYKDYPEFQTINGMAIRHNVSNTSKTLPIPFLEELDSHNKCDLLGLKYIYVRVYDVFVKYNLFRWIEFSDPYNLNLSKEIDDILRVVGN